MRRPRTLREEMQWRSMGYEPVRRHLTAGEAMARAFDEIAERKRLEAEREYWAERNARRNARAEIRVDLRKSKQAATRRQRRGILARIVDAIAERLGFVRKGQR